MLLIPAWVWRGGPVYRAVCVGVPVGIFLAALVFAESGVLLGALVAFVVIGVFNGIVVSRRMSKAWPAADELNPAERVAVCAAVRRGRQIDDPRLAPAALAYVGALRTAREQSRRVQWVFWPCAAVVLVLAVFDTYTATTRLAVVSWLFVVFFAVEIFWWPRIQDRLLANAERTAQSASRWTG
ncbi:hypothetical protein A5791_14530 [Mycobacterium sp. 852002-51163_SCH5372311]|uniref:hypothetical protein n=1 Tax=Mycobacterium sp. 852002-51163_SCH5372311 TaxID=1834097 RepID=UPI000801DDFD|nr:hypothetical protein [Mycobacterium sp. 852002-51163_SCH5372311]OBF92082.1 hypothetical protein A5791_14530 [Mycobacterium sp. 852002-51163_SCH5372311]